MAKRSRGRIRPGQRRPLDRSARPAASRPAAGRAPEASEPIARTAIGLTAEEEARAAELERQLREQERAAVPAPRRSTSAAAVLPRGSRLLDPSQEYAYVARDLRRILIVQASLVGVLVGLWIFIEGLHVVRI